MSLLPSQVIARVGIRGGFYPGDPVALETAFATNPLTALSSENITPSSLRADLLAVEQDIATLVAYNREHPWRGLLADVTANLPKASLVPTVGLTGKPIIGNYGSVYDAVDNNVCVESFTTEEIRQLVINPNNWRVLDVYAYAITGRRIYHTRTNVIIDVCVFDIDARKTAIDANGALLFPDAVDMYFFGMMLLLANTDARLAELSKMYAPHFTAWQQAISAGGTQVKAAA